MYSGYVTGASDLLSGPVSLVLQESHASVPRDSRPFLITHINSLVPSSHGFGWLSPSSNFHEDYTNSSTFKHPADLCTLHARLWGGKVVDGENNEVDRAYRR